MNKTDVTTRRHVIPPAIIFFLLSPILSFFIALKDVIKKSNGVVFILFYASYGYAHSFLDPRGDSYRKAINFTRTNPNSSSIDIIKNYIQGSISDIFEPLLRLFVRGFTDNPHVYLAVVGTIGGTFIYLSLRKVWKFWSAEYSINLYIASILCILLLNPVMIGGVRFFIAASVFVYALITILLEKKLWAWLLLFVSPLIHFSLWVSVVFTLLAQFLHIKSSLLWKGLVFVCLASIVFNAQDWGGVFASYDISETNQMIGDRALAYSSEKTAIRYTASLTANLMSIQQYLTRLSVLLPIFLVSKKISILQLSRDDSELYRLVLLFLTFGYIFISFSVVGERYLLPGLFLFFIFLGRLTTYKSGGAIFGKLLRIILLLSIFSIGWVIANSYFLIDHRLFYAPLPFLFV